jgi:hypothetical protein
VKHLLILFPLLWGSIVPGQTSYIYDVDLTDLQDDRLHVELFVPAEIGDTATFCLPRIVPGIHGAMDHGRSIS